MTAQRERERIAAALQALAERDAAVNFVSGDVLDIIHAGTPGQECALQVWDWSAGRARACGAPTKSIVVVGGDQLFAACHRHDSRLRRAFPYLTIAKAEGEDWKVQEQERARLGLPATVAARRPW